MRLSLLPPVLLAERAYMSRVKAIAGSTLIGYWPMGEPSGAVAYDQSGQANNGAYTGVTLGEPGAGDGRTCPLWDGANDYNNLYSAAFNADFTPAEFTVAVWAKVSAAAVWTDATTRYLMRLRADGNNETYLVRTATNNQLQAFCVGGAVGKQVASTALNGSTAWFHVAITRSAAGDAMKFFINGAQVGSTQTGIGAWVGALASSVTVMGAASNTPTAVWSGWMAHGLVCSAALSAANIAKLAKV